MNSCILCSLEVYFTSRPVQTFTSSVSATTSSAHTFDRIFISSGSFSWQPCRALTHRLWLAAKGVSWREIWLHPKWMWMSSLWLSQQLRVLSTCRHHWLPLIQVWFWICASLADKMMTSMHEFMWTQGRSAVNLCLWRCPTISCRL